MTTSKKKLALNQKAVLWEFDSYDVNGEPRVSSPVEIECRWESGSRQVFVSASSVAIDNEVFVDREIALGSMLRLGALADLPATPDQIEEVVVYEETPDLKGNVYERKVLLRRWKESLPTIV